MTPSSDEIKRLPVVVWILIATGGLGCGFIALMIIAVTALSSCGCNATEIASKQYVGAMLRSEQAYFLEYGKFTPSLNELQGVIPSGSTNYRYALTLQDGSPQPVMITAVPKKPGLKSYTGVVFANGTGQAATSIQQICETDQPSRTPPVMPIASQNSSEPIRCPPGSQAILEPATEAESKQYVGAILRSEEAYFLEYGKLTPSLNELQVGIPSGSTDYRYALTLQDGSPQAVMITAVPKKPGLKSYTGVVFANGTGQAATSIQQICETDQPSRTPPVMPIASQNSSEPIRCPPGSQAILEPATEAESKQYVGAILRSEEAYFLEYGKLTPSLNELQVGIPSGSTDYRYALTLQDGSPQAVMITAVPKKPGLKSYTGVVFVNGTGQADMTGMNVGQQICETKQPSPTPPVMPIAPQNISEPIPCPPGSQEIR
ncbi:MAG: hypothetical protein DCF22_15015 [Leptolyngbya sp.]|nr:MAG: hypothetical protein DCF22_15015 [Leptolyngbya sp.]